MINFKEYSQLTTPLTEGNNGEEYQHLAKLFADKVDKELRPYISFGIRKILGFTMQVDLLGYGKDARGVDYHNSMVASYMMHIEDSDRENKFNYLQGRLRDMGIKPLQARNQKSREAAVEKLAMWFNKNKSKLIDYINGTYSK